MREINSIIIHCTASPMGLAQSVADIRKDHLKRGFDDIGYHFVIRLDGNIDVGRQLEVVGAHAYGHNNDSVGIAYVGGELTDTRTFEQKRSMLALIKILRSVFPQTTIRGHRDLPGVRKRCPSFEVKDWLLENGIDPN